MRFTTSLGRFLRYKSSTYSPFQNAHFCASAKTKYKFEVRGTFASNINHLDSPVYYQRRAQSANSK
jgi:hypothetical protein